MSEEKDVENETSVEKEETEAAQAEATENEEVVEEKPESENVNSEQDQPVETEEIEQNKLEPPPAPDDPEDKWCDNYQFVDDEKVVIDYEGLYFLDSILI